VEQHRLACAAAQADSLASEIDREPVGLNWTGKIPYLRLIHCVVDESIKPFYIARYDTQPGRSDVENRNSSVRELNVWEKIANLWNDENFEPDTLVFPDLHPFEFVSSEKLSFDKVEKLAKATPVKVKENLAKMTLAMT
jgi:hypothetical protein